MKPHVVSRELSSDWTPDQAPQEIIAAREEIDQITHDLGKEHWLQIFEDAIETDPRTNIQYALLRDGDDSNERMMVASNPLAGGMQPQQLIRAQLLKDAARKMEITDRNGNPLPIMLIGAPTVNANPNFTKEEKKDALTAFAERQINLIDRHVGQAALFGTSLGGEFSARAGAMLTRNVVDLHVPDRDLELHHVGLQDPVRVKRRGGAAFLNDYVIRGAGMKDVIEADRASGFMTYRLLHGIEKDLDTEISDDYPIQQRSQGIAEFGKSVLHPMNRKHLRQSLGRDRLHLDLSTIMAAGVDVSLARGSESSMIPRRLGDWLLTKIEIELEAELKLGKIATVGVLRDSLLLGENHAWMDNAIKSAAVYLPDLKAAA